MGRPPKSTSISDVNYSLQGSNQNEFDRIITEQSVLAVSSAAPIEPQQFKVYRLVNTKRKGRVYIDGLDEAKNPKTGRVERIYLLTGAHSIWASELEELLKDKDYMRQNRKSLEFNSGVLRVALWDERTIEFIENCKHYIDNPTRRTGSNYEFFLYDPEKQQKAALDKEMLEINMAIAANSLDEVKATKLASFLGISPVDNYGFPKSPAGIKQELILFAKRQPLIFQKNLDSKEVEISYLIRKAIYDAKVDVGGYDGNVMWAGGRVICKLPISRQPLEYLTELALTNSDDGRRFLEELERVSK